MGTSTIYKKMNDFGLSFKNMTKKDLKELELLSPYNKGEYYRSWSAPLELHNGNVNILVWWKGKLMRSEDAPKELSNKYYDKYTGKTRKEYEWTLLKKMILNEIEHLDKIFKKEIIKPNKK